MENKKILLHSSIELNNKNLEHVLSKKIFLIYYIKKIIMIKNLYYHQYKYGLLIIIFMMIMKILKSHPPQFYHFLRKI